jgi:hypothetical protein
MKAPRRECLSEPALVTTAQVLKNRFDRNSSRGKNLSSFNRLEIMTIIVAAAITTTIG